MMRISLAAPLAGVALLAFACAGWAAELTPREQAGKKIFLEGVSPSGMPLDALVGPHAMKVAGSTLPCGSCHGPDGRGRPEGAVKPPAITWRELAKPYGHRHENGREHPAFDEKNFAESLTFGTDPAGNKLDTSMPRYVMSHQDMADLIAYLKRLDTDFDPGIAADRLRIGTLIPAQGARAELGQALVEILEGRLREINAKGGLFGRRLELVRADLPDDKAAALASADKLFRQQDVFAVLSPFAAGLEQELANLAEQAKVPVVGPFTQLPDRAAAVNRYTFHLLPGLSEQSRALVDFATKQLGIKNSVVGLVFPTDEVSRKAAEGAESAFRQAGWDKVVRAEFAPGQLPAQKLVAELQQRGVQLIVFLGGDNELAAIGPHIRDAIWTPYLLATGTRVARAAYALPNTLGNRVFLSFPSLPTDVTPLGAMGLGAARGQNQDHSMHGMSGMAMPAAKHQPLQASAYAATLVLEEGLKRAGRDLSRLRLVEALETLASFETGVMPPLTYSSSRHTGSSGVHIVSVDLGARRFRPTGHFIRVD